MSLNRVIISGGGTGGHIFPAVAIADCIKQHYPACEILFVGADGKMEMEKVPRAGYKIVGLPIRGLQRKLTLQNLSFPFKLWKSLRMAKKIIREFKPQIAIGVGGYASAATLRVAAKMGVPTLLQEQNSYPGITNKWLADKAKIICVAYENLDRFFPKEKLVMTGNPVRMEMVAIEGKKQKAISHFRLDPAKKTVLVIGGSLGARTVNESVLHNISNLLDQNVQLIWQCGKVYVEQLKADLEKLKGKTVFSDQGGPVYLSDFVFEMDLAYAAADLIISRAGAISVSEVCLVGKPVILVPSPNVAEDHQTKNAMALVNKNAAILVKDIEAKETLIKKALDLFADQKLAEQLAENIKKLGIADAPVRILKEIEKIIR
ncbi:MAG: undecaprenyldiphospho-muramoylpentapeptide beta-N-acetylglucosaminyltransferase [Crocinitomicaceae bacterium]|nr:undecaprenyldiphospho-muramoylpentapeptide beta-N-acetylglucosaminyltransferase [Crocinitomicaceae bacterium]MBK8926964.1 undecaprenyldiphospho-muramoylpentapeptide beta-N-acetylglucosaminyltransferase [Crocinitomicaceae bacterium]